ncbi:hypothetical protein EJ03DRAFT_91798 [Teratosphaeria nubilosa]|uniref:Uncharacterized protein n=1 Tax=Teratosphaeria nubilosa TaxID=161662 RepID=A0A6G1LA03_9PEZI|nr:hypothetical protein EJ03DRAFT_91798 [Teratosphaeria nubilosa]
MMAGRILKPGSSPVPTPAARGPITLETTPAAGNADWKRATKCLEYCCSDFLNMYEPPIMAVKADLTNYPLPLFGADHVKFLVPGRTYDEAFAMSARLASNLLLTDNAVPYINTTVCGELRLDSRGAPGKVVQPRELVPTGVNDDGSEQQLYRPAARYPKKGLEGVNNVTRQHARGILEQLHHVVEVQVLGPADESSVDWDEDPIPASGFVERVQGPLTEKCANMFPRGCLSRTTIVFPLFVVPELQANVQEYQWAKRCKPDDWLQSIERSAERLLHEYVRVAQTMVHEAGHVLHNAGIGNVLQETFYEHSPLNEAGFEMENAIFGGVLVTPEPAAELEPRGCDYVTSANPASQKRTRATAEGPMCFHLKEWPSTSIWKSYKHDRHSISLREGVKPPPFDRIYRIPNGFVGLLVSQWFWEEVVPRFGLRVLQPAKTTGWLFQSDENGDVKSALNGGRLPLRTPKIISAEVRELREGFLANLKPVVKPPSKEFLATTRGQLVWDGRQWRGPQEGGAYKARSLFGGGDDAWGDRGRVRIPIRVK